MPPSSPPIFREMKFFSTLVAATLGSLIAMAVVVVFFLMFFLALAASSEDTPRVRDGSILVAEISGPVPEQVSGDPFSRLLTDEPALDLRTLKRALEMASVDPRISGLWLKVGTSTTPWASMQEIRTALVDFKASGKPVVASSEDFFVTESEYFLMSAADSIYAAPGGLFEFNGFAIVASFYKGLLDKLDLEAQVVRAGKFKSAVEPYQRTDFSDENREQLSELIREHETEYLEAISEARGVSVDELRALAREDAILAVEQALGAGLITGLLHADQLEGVLRSSVSADSAADLRTIPIKRYARTPASSAGLREGRNGEVAVVYAVGTIVGGTSDSDSPFVTGLVGSETFAKAMQEARESKSVKSVVVRVNSPGGFAPAADAMLREIELTAAEKPVVVSMGDLAASGGYWISMAADTIVADPLTLTGSIGVFSLFFDTGDFFRNKLGVTFDKVSTSPYADMFSGVRPLSEAERQLLQRFTDETYERFIEIVQENRGMSRDEVVALAEGRVWLGTNAKELGLVDVLGDLDDAVDIAAELAGLEEGTYTTRALPRPKSFFERMTRSMEAEAVRVWQSVSLSDAERAILDEARQLHNALRDHGTVQARMLFDVRIQ